METLDDFYHAAQAKLNEFDSAILSYGLEGQAQADHICYKCESSHSFERVRRLFEPHSAFIYQSMIAGRRIALIGLSRPLASSLGAIQLLELSDQKPDNSQREGFDHVEVYPIKQTYLAIVQHLQDQGLNVKEVSRPHHTTHDIKLEKSMLLRLTHEPLLDKVKREEIS